LERGPRRISDDKEVYEALFNILYYSATGSGFTTRAPLEDARFTHVLSSAKKLLEYAFELNDKYKASLSSVAREVYRMAKLAMYNEHPKYIVLCDGASLIEALYVAYKVGPAAFIGVAINPGGNTETYKFILEPHEYVAREASLALREIAQRIASEVGAEYEVFREIDDAISINSGKVMAPSTVVNIMYGIASKLTKKLNSLKRTFDATIMMVSDHGYDVIPRGSDVFGIQHCWSPRALSVLAPLVVL
jgi:hypothetical protein